MLSRILVIILCAFSWSAFAQCPQFFDTQGELSDNPLWKFCDVSESTLSIQSNEDLVGPYTIDWGDGTTTNGSDLVAGDIESHTYPAGDGVYDITITANGCTITGQYVKERPVKASIEVPPSGVTQTCAPGSIEFLNNSTGNSQTTTYQWFFGDGTTTGVLDDSNAGQTVSHEYQRGTVDCDTRVTLIAENECSTRPSEATFEPVQIWDLDQPAILAAPTLLCWPDNEVTFRNVSEMNCAEPEEGNTFQRYERWIFHDYFGPGQDSIIDWRPWPPSPARTIAYPATGTYEVTLQVENFCGITETTTEITIIDEPEALFTLDKNTVCVGEQVTMTKLTGAPANRFRYNKGTGNWRNFGGATERFSYNNPGTYQVGFAIDISNSSPACKDTFYLPVTVVPNSDPNFDVTIDRSCGSVEVSFTNNSSNAVNYSWDFDNGNTSTATNPPSQTYTQAGTYTVSLTTENARGCASTFSRDINVFTEPIPDFEVEDICLGERVGLTGSVIKDPSDPVVSWNWDFGDGNTATGQQTSHLYTTPGTYNISLEVITANCQGEVVKEIVVQPRPSAGFQASPDVGCAPINVRFIDNSVNAQKLYWDYDDGNVDSIVRNPFHVFRNTSSDAVVRNVMQVAVNPAGCADTAINAVRILPEIDAAFDFNVVNNCTFITVDFVALSANAVDYQWDFGDGSVSTERNPSHNYFNETDFNQTVTVTLRVENKEGCVATAEQFITIKPTTNIEFEGVPDEACTPAEIVFQADDGGADYQWDFGDGGTANGKTVVNTYINNSATSRDYTVTLTVTDEDGCVTDINESVTVHPKPQASFQTNATVGCAPFEVQLENLSTGGESYLWRYGDGIIVERNESQHRYTYFNTGTETETYTISLEAISAFGCRDTAFSDVDVLPGVQAQAAPIEDGCSPLQVTVTGSGGVSQSWDFGDGTSVNEDTTVKTWVNNTLNLLTYEVTFTAVNAQGCAQEIAQEVTVYPKPIAAFNASQSSTCSPSEVLLDNNSVGATDFLWRYGNGLISDTDAPQHQYAYTNSDDTIKTYDLSLQATSSFGCSDTAVSEISVSPDINPSIVGVGEGCTPLQLFLRGTGGTAYTWDFGDGNTASGQEVTHVFRNNTNITQTYTVSLQASNAFGCQKTVTQEVTVYPKPQSRFEANSYSACAPLEVTLQNNSEGASNFVWKYGDGVVSGTAADSHPYSFDNNTNSNQEYRTTLEVISDLGCRDTSERIFTVFPNIDPPITGAVGGCTPYEVTVSSEGAQSYSWDFGNGQSGSGASATATLLHQGGNNPTNYTVTLTAESENGCIATKTTQVPVFPNPDASFTVSDNSGCPSLDVTFTPNPSAYESYLWDFQPGARVEENTAVPVSFSFNNNQSGVQTYNPSLVVTNNFGCRDTQTTPIDVFPNVLADVAFNGTGCSPLTVKFFNTTSGAQSYAWDFGAFGTSTNATPTVTFTHNQPNITTIPFEMVATSSFGCTDVVEDEVTLLPKPSAGFTVNQTEGCQPLEVQFTNTSTDATEYNWQYGFGENDNESATTFTRTFTNFNTTPQQRDVLLIATNSSGCSDSISQNITVYPEVKANFASLSDGCSPLNQQVENLSTGEQNIQWFFGNGAQSTSNIFSGNFFNTSGEDRVDSVMLVASNIYGCQDTLVRNFTVFANPEAEFSATPGSQKFPNATVNLNNTTQGTGWDYTWYFGDGSAPQTGAMPSYDYDTWGSYEIALVAAGTRCKDSTTQLVVISPPAPRADFTGGGVGCTPYTVTFSDASEFATSYQWLFGDGGGAPGPNPTYTYNEPGTYTVTLRVQGPDGTTDEKVITNTVEVYQSASAFFTMRNAQVFETADPVEFINLSTDASEYTWDFGDGNLSNEFEPSHFYEAPGNYLVSLIADNAFGCADTFNLPNAVEVLRGGLIELPNAFTPNPNGPTGGRYDPQSLENNVFYPFTKNVAEYKLEIFTRWGEKIFESTDVAIGWDGYSDGELCQQEVYVYKVSAVFENGEVFEDVGDVTLLR